MTTLMENKELARLEVDKDVVWKGNTLEELKYRRALSLVKLELQKDSMRRELEHVSSFVSPSRSGLLSVFKVGKPLGKIKYINYIITGYRAAKMAYVLWKKIKRR